MADDSTTISITLLQVLKLTQPGKGFVLCEEVQTSLEIIGRVKSFSQADELSFNISISDESVEGLKKPVVVIYNLGRPSTDKISSKLMNTTIAEADATNEIKEVKYNSENACQSSSEEEGQLQLSRGWNFTRIEANFPQVVSCQNSKLRISDESHENLPNLILEEKTQSSILESNGRLEKDSAENLFSIPKLEFEVGGWVRCIGVSKFVNDTEIRFFARSVAKIDNAVAEEAIERQNTKIMADYRRLALSSKSRSMARDDPQQTERPVSTSQRVGFPPLLKDSNLSSSIEQQSLLPTLPIIEVPTDELNQKLTTTDDRELITRAEVERRKLENDFNGGKSQSEEVELGRIPGTMGRLNQNQKLVLEVFKSRQRGFTAQELTSEMENKLSLSCVETTLMSLAENGLCWNDCLIEGNDAREVWWMVD